eukprot:gene8398-11356_t
MKRIIFLIFSYKVLSFDIIDYSHYLDYLPYRLEGFSAIEDFRTAPNPPLHLRNRKMELGPLGRLNIKVEDVLKSPLWPSKWPYGFEDFRPLDYTRDDVINTGPQYEFSQSLIKADNIALIPGILRVPIRRHFILPKDKIALSDHMSEYFFDGARVLELFSCYSSILPKGFDLGPTVGVGWYDEEMKRNKDLDDFIVQDVSVDPFLPIADNYFDFVVVPAMFQLFQRPLDMFREINRVLKPGGTAIIGVKLSMWSFLSWKQGRYYVETNYLEDILALGSFFHYAGGFSKPQAYDLTLPESNVVGKFKDTFFPQPRLDFYACVEARKRSDSPHGKNTVREDPSKAPDIEGIKFRPRVMTTPITNEENFGPFY